jgi:hypothetical protein
MRRGRGSEGAKPGALHARSLQTSQSIAKRRCGCLAPCQQEMRHRLRASPSCTEPFVARRLSACDSGRGGKYPLACGLVDPWRVQYCTTTRVPLRVLCGDILFYCQTVESCLFFCDGWFRVRPANGHTLSPSHPLTLSPSHPIDHNGAPLPNITTCDLWDGPLSS